VLFSSVIEVLNNTCRTIERYINERVAKAEGSRHEFPCGVVASELGVSIEDVRDILSKMEGSFHMLVVAKNGAV
jgi:hypothetical protein